MTEANRRALLRSSRGIAPRPRSGALLGRESHAASLGAFQPMSPISGSFAVRALSSLSHVEESITQGPPAMGKIHNAKLKERNWCPLSIPPNSQLAKAYPKLPQRVFGTLHRTNDAPVPGIGERGRRPRGGVGHAGALGPRAISRTRCRGPSRSWSSGTGRPS